MVAVVAVVVAGVVFVAVFLLVSGLLLWMWQLNCNVSTKPLDYRLPGTLVPFGSQPLPFPHVPTTLLRNLEAAKPGGAPRHPAAKTG